MQEIPRWTVWEAQAESSRTYDNPFQEVTAHATLVSPSGAQRTVDAFWDGDRTWRVRFAPGEVGEWTWRLVCSDEADQGLNGPSGTFRCAPYAGDNPLYRHGPLQLAADRRHLVHADEERFFWLGDTAWNGVLRAREVDWGRYLEARRRQCFTAVQFVSTQWRGCTALLGSELLFTGTEQIQVHPLLFQRLDLKVAAINAYGLVAAPVLLWALWESDPGQVLAQTDAIRLARYLVARWGAYQVVWFLGGDGRYEDERAERWRQIGRAVFGPDRDRLVTMHPCGQSWVGPAFRGEPWYDFIGYQSGHGSSEEHLRWLVEGPPAVDWAQDPPLPVINLEPNYEDHPSYHIQRRFSAQEVRRAAYWSLLVSPPAGVTFGHNAIWVWSEKPEAPEGHDRIGIVPPWEHALDTPGVHSMTQLRRFFDRLPWTRLRPAPELVVDQPGREDPARFIAAARAGALAVIYMPVGGEVRLDLGSIERPARVRWFDPRTGVWSEGGAVSTAEAVLTAPGEEDWLLCVGELSL